MRYREEERVPSLDILFAITCDKANKKMSISIFFLVCFFGVIFTRLETEKKTLPDLMEEAAKAHPYPANKIGVGRLYLPQMSFCAVLFAFAFSMCL